MKKLAVIIFMFMIVGCGQEPLVTEGGTGTTEQGVEDNSSTVSIDLTGVFEALCISRPDWAECARWCELHPDSQACN